MIPFILVCLAVLYIVYKVLVPARRPLTESPKEPVQKELSPGASIVQNAVKFPPDNRKTTIALDSIFPSEEPFDESDVQILSSICECSDVYLLLEAHSDQEEEQARKRISENLIKSNITIPSHRFLFYSTEIGKKAMARQLQPHLHIDGEKVICEAMNPFVKVMVHVTSLTQGAHDSTEKTPWHRISSLSKLVSIGNN
mmetsp:Transcript_11750/g.17793  ORF Transcript_11750/g.17793 Transcript_11750/m.17793 type:complete len:198 (+) Transcript_11750:126-719(+)